MPLPSAPRFVLAALCGAALSQTACGLIPIEATADGRIEVEIRGEDNTFQEIVTYDPNENEDYREYKDQFERGRIESILITVQDVKPGNSARWAAGNVDVKASSSSEWVEGVSGWQGLRLLGEPDPVSGDSAEIQDEVFLNPAEYDNYQDLNEVVFQGDRGPIDFRVNGIANEGPVEFDLEVIITFTVEN